MCGSGFREFNRTDGKKLGSGSIEISGMMLIAHNCPIIVPESFIFLKFHLQFFLISY